MRFHEDFDIVCWYHCQVIKPLLGYIVKGWGGTRVIVKVQVQESHHSRNEANHERMDLVSVTRRLFLMDGTIIGAQ